MTPPSPNDPLLNQVYITHLPAPDRTPSRILALGTALTIYAAFGTGLALLWRSPARGSLPQPSQAIVLQELDDFAPPPPPPPGRGARETGPRAVPPPQPEVPVETPRTLPAEALPPPPVPAGASTDPGGGVRDPCVLRDGRTILFSYRPAGTENYHLHLIQSDGTGIRRLTDGPWDDIEPAALADGSIIFVSSRARRW
ncbi:MAG: hypothetical protein HGA66_19015, partial [Holophaga sp.]|nr:hypothetical protein [Holophaga sp.]